MSGTHTLACDGPVLISGQRQERPWSCTCGQWTSFGYDSTVRKAFRGHVEQERASLASQLREQMRRDVESAAQHPAHEKRHMPAIHQAVQEAVQACGSEPFDGECGREWEGGDGLTVHLCRKPFGHDSEEQCRCGASTGPESTDQAF